MLYRSEEGREVLSELLDTPIGKIQLRLMHSGRHGAIGPGSGHIIITVPLSRTYFSQVEAQNDRHLKYLSDHIRASHRLDEMEDAFVKSNSRITDMRCQLSTVRGDHNYKPDVLLAQARKVLSSLPALPDLGAPSEGRSVN